MQILIFTDLDGTLLEHQHYSFDAARPSLERLAREDVPVVINSSKTRAEISYWQEKLDLHSHFICENGAALCMGKQITQTSAAPLSGWLGEVHRIRDEAGFDFSGFSDWSEAEVMQHTGLDKTGAMLAKQREFSEPILWRDSEARWQDFVEAIAGLDLQVEKGGRFYSLQSPFDKGDAMRALIREISTEEELITIAFGDSPNDKSMLDQADIAVVVKSGKSHLLEPSGPTKTYRSTLPGPAGWNEAMQEIFKLIDAGELGIGRNS